MKKYFTFLLLIIVFQTVNAQIVEDDFEGNTTITTWYGDDCGMDNDFSNPFSEGANPSATVLKYTDIGGQYANVQFQITDFFALTEKNTFSFKIYVPSSSISGSQNNQVSLKLQNIVDSWTSQSEIIKTITLDEWQTVTFDFENDNFINLDGGSLPPIQRTDFNKVVIQVNGENNEDEVVAYIDDMSYYNTVSNDPVYDELVWSDEFDDDGAIDSDKWFHQTQLPSGGSWYNGEIQHYTDRTVNAVVDDGILSIIAKQETFTNQGVTKDYTSARLNSKFAFQYGKVEIKAKLPTGVGTWPAIWMLGKNITESGAYWQTQGFGTLGWPACGEIDIMEHWGYNQNYVQSATHTTSSSGATVNHGGQLIPTASTAFHIYTLEWSPEKLKFSVDGNLHYTYKPDVQNADSWPFDAEQYLLLNVAIQPSIIGTGFTQDAMEIDYVRVYQEGNSSNLEELSETSFSYYPNPVKDELNIVLPNFIGETFRLNIHSTDGKLVKSYDDLKLEGNNIVLKDLGGLPKGVFVVSFISKDKKGSFKIVKK